MYKSIKGDLQEIVALVESLPEKYRERCFDILLSHLLAGESRAPQPKAPPQTEKGAPPAMDEPNKKPVLPAKVRVFLARHKLTPEQIQKVALIENGDVLFIKEPQIAKVAKAQIHWALLIALRTALLGGDFELDPEAVRSVCIDKGAYDKSNFIANFRNNKNCFAEIPAPQGEPVKLSRHGEKELSELIQTLANGAA